MAMAREPRIKDVMTPFPYSISIDAPIGAARRLMLEKHVHHLPVTDDGKLAGIVTDRDIKLLLGPEFGSPDPKELTVEDAYVPDGFAVDLEMPLVDVLETMIDRHLGAALITAHGRLAGIFTTMDACRALHAHLKETYHPPPEVA
jgi:acetoin utilization protein AcuB